MTIRVVGSRLPDATKRPTDKHNLQQPFKKTRSSVEFHAARSGFMTASVAYSFNEGFSNAVRKVVKVKEVVT